MLVANHHIVITYKGCCHRGEDNALLKRRDGLYRMVQKGHPESWSGRMRNWQPEGPVMLNPEREIQAA